MASRFTLGPLVTSITCSSVAVQVATTTVSSPVISWTIQNQSTSSVYLGNSAVSSSAGLLLTAGSSFSSDKHQARGSDNQPYGLDLYYLMTPTLGTAATTTVVLLRQEIINRTSG